MRREGGWATHDEDRGQNNGAGRTLENKEALERENKEWPVNQEPES